MSGEAKAPASTPAPAPAPVPAALGEKKLTGAELKAKAKADKAARRAQAKVSKENTKGEAAISSSPGPLGPSAAEVKGSKSKGKPDAAAAGSQATSRPTIQRSPGSAARKEQKDQIPQMFSHLSMAKRLSMAEAHKDVHPMILQVGQQMATFAIDESITRLNATLLGFKRVIESYSAPSGQTLARHFIPHVLNPQIEYLTACRPMCFSMGNAIRWLKLRVSKIDVDSDEDKAKKDLCQALDFFIQERITLTDHFIVEAGAKRIQDDDVILIHGRRTLVERAIIKAHSSGTKFKVIVIDDPYEKQGLELAKRLAGEGIPVRYSGDLGGLHNNMEDATKVLFAAEAVFSNGAMYARQGTCDVALAAKDYSKQVITLCETINITERVATDSLTYNEIDPDRCTAASFRLLFDTTPESYVSLLVTELGTVQPRSAPELLRKLEQVD